jgi:protein O-mannosyl-transferase
MMERTSNDRELMMTRRNTTQKTSRAPIVRFSQPAPSAGGTPAGRRTFAPAAICIGLALAVVAVYAQTASFKFIYFDDDASVFKSDRVLGGLTRDNLVWAFTEYHAGYWQPVTAISHMVDVDLYRDPSSEFGQWAGGHHLTNMFLHACNSILLFLALRRMTGDLWPSAFAAAVFALHPMRVESVAWVTERKDMLSGLFFFLTLHAYTSYTRRPSLARYLLVVLPFVLGLMSKPMVVTLPFVLLLLDYWPLGRLRRTAGSPSIARLLAEKAPLLALGLAFSLITVSAQDTAVKSIKDFPLPVRLSNALVSYVAYIRQMLWPSDLAAFYPHPKDSLPAWQIAGAAVILIAITVAVIRAGRTKPYLLTGWLWYLGVLAPVIGLMQSGIQARADRFTYLPQIGLIFGLTWLAAGLASSWHLQPRVLGVAAGVLIAALALCSQEQTRAWSDTDTFYTTILKHTTRNWFMEYNLGTVLARDGKHIEAVKHFREAALINPDAPNVQLDYGGTLCTLGRYEEGLIHLRRSLEIASPDDIDIFYKAAVVFHKLSRFFTGTEKAHLLDEAWNALERARDVNPKSEIMYASLASIRADQGRFEEAIPLYQNAIDLCLARLGAVERHSELAKTYALLGTAYFETGRMRDALNAYREAIRLQPDDVLCLNAAAQLAAMSPDPAIRSGTEAVTWAEHAVNIDGHDPLLMGVLAAAYAEANRFPDAVATGKRALEMAVAQGLDPEEIKKLRDQLTSYEAGIPVRDPPPKATKVDH